jgi:hypothetical protein
MTSATSLVLIAAGAILAFAVSLEVGGVNFKTVGAILIVVGGIGLAFALVTLIGYAPWGGRAAGVETASGARAAEPPVAQPPVRPPSD